MRDAYADEAYQHLFEKIGPEGVQNIHTSTMPVAGLVSSVSRPDGGSTPSARDAAQAGMLAPDNMPAMILCVTRGLWLYWVVRGDIEYAGDFSAELAAQGSA